MQPLTREASTTTNELLRRVSCGTQTDAEQGDVEVSSDVLISSDEGDDYWDEAWCGSSEMDDTTIANVSFE